MTNDIIFAESLVQKLEEKKKSLTRRCWKAKIDIACISVDVPSFIPDLNARKNAVICGFATTPSPHLFSHQF